MASPTHSVINWTPAPAPRLGELLPLLYEDEGQDEMGESNRHLLSEQILRDGIKAHLEGQSQYHVFSNLNLYYHPDDPRAYVSPDVFVVVPKLELGEDVSSLRLGEEIPVPELTIEVLSKRTAQQRDLDEKMTVYRLLGVQEYILVDVAGLFLPSRLLMKRLRSDGAYSSEQDPDGGVTSRFGFRVVIEADNVVRVLHAGTGRRYRRPNEMNAVENELIRSKDRTQAAEEARQQTDEENRRLKDQAQAAEEARQQAEEARQQMDEESRRLKDQARAAEEARQQAEEARQQMDEESRRLKDQARAAEEARQQAEEARQQMDEESRRLKDQAQAAEEARQQAEEENRRLKDQARAAEEARQQAEEARQQTDEESRRLKDRAQVVEEARRQTDEENRRLKDEARAIEEARRQMEEEVRRLKAALAQLQPPLTEPPS